MLLPQKVLLRSRLTAMMLKCMPKEEGEWAGWDLRLVVACEGHRRCEEGNLLLANSVLGGCTVSTNQPTNL